MHPLWTLEYFNGSDVRSTADLYRSSERFHVGTIPAIFIYWMASVQKSTIAIVLSSFLTFCYIFFCLASCEASCTDGVDWNDIMQRWSLFYSARYGRYSKFFLVNRDSAHISFEFLCFKNEKIFFLASLRTFFLYKSIQLPTRHYPINVNCSICIYTFWW